MSTQTYRVQVRRNKDRWQTKYALTSETEAWFYYRCINIGNGWRKRLICDQLVLAKAASL